MIIKRKQEDSKSHFHTRHQEIGGGQHNAAPLTTDPCTYVYNFADGSNTTLVFSFDGISGIDSSWLSELQELDRLEYNNNHAQTRRHCSLDAQDPEGMGGYYEGDNMNFVQFDLEVEEFLSTLPTDLEVIARLLYAGFSAADIARQQGVNRSTICRKIKKIQDALTRYNP